MGFKKNPTTRCKHEMTDIDIEAMYKTSRWEAVKLAIGMLTGSNSLMKIWEHATPVQVTGPSRISRDEYWRGVLGDALPAIEQGYLTPTQRDREQRDHRAFPRWSFCCTLFDAVDRGEGAPPRIHINTPWRHVTIALGPHGRLAQNLDPRNTETKLNGYLVLRRYDQQVCHNVVALERTIDGDIMGYRVCTLNRGHTGPCWDWKDREEVWTPTIHFVA